MLMEPDMEDFFPSSEETSVVESTVESLSLNLDDLEDKDSIESSRSYVKEEEQLYSNDRRFFTMLNEMRRQATLTDIQIVCRTQVFHAHKIILVAFCPYFDRMLINDGPETVIMNDLNPCVMEEFLTFIYTGAVDMKRLDEVELKDFFYAGEKFECPNFEKLFHEQLTNSLTPKNFGFILNLFRSVANSRFESKIIDYISQNLNDIWKEPSFMSVSESHLAKIFLESSKQMKNHDLLLKCLVGWVSYCIETRSTVLPRILPVINPKRISKKLAFSLLQKENPVVSIPELIDTLQQAKESDDDSSTIIAASSDEEGSKTEMESDVVSFSSNSAAIAPSILVVGRDEANRASIVQYLLHEEIWTDIEDTGLSFETRPGIGYYKQNVYIIGGQDMNSAKLSECYVYDMKLKKSKRLCDLRIARSCALVFGLDDCIYVTGGLGRFSNTGLSHMEYLESLNDTVWKNAQPMRTKRNDTGTVCILNKRAYVAGGGSLRCEYFDSQYKTWRVICPITDVECSEHSPFLVAANNNLFSFEYYKPSRLLMYSEEADKWMPFYTKGEPPECVLSAIGIESKIYALDKTFRFHVLDLVNNTWFSYVKLPKCMAHPVYLAFVNSE